MPMNGDRVAECRLVQTIAKPARIMRKGILPKYADQKTIEPAIGWIGEWVFVEKAFEQIGSFEGQLEGDRSRISVPPLEQATKLVILASCRYPVEIILAGRTLEIGKPTTHQLVGIAFVQQLPEIRGDEQGTTSTQLIFHRAQGGPELGRLGVGRVHADHLRPPRSMIGVSAVTREE